MSKPYVVSADIYLLMERWVAQNGFILPPKEFFSHLREEFLAYMCQIFPDFELVSEDEISQGIASLVAKSGLPTISLDRVYFQSELNLEITRLVDKEGNDRGLGNRAGAQPLSQQIKKLQMSGLREVVIVDDVVFTGALLERIIDLLSRIKIRVPLICAGVGIADGIKRINDTKREVRCVRTYVEVIDQVCERDFYPGVPLSGRLLIGDENIGIPYLLPFGNPGKWASIPKKWQKPFSRFCISQTIKLFRKVGRASQRKVCCSDLERKVFSLPMNEVGFEDALSEVLCKSLT